MSVFAAGEIPIRTDGAARAPDGTTLPWRKDLLLFFRSFVLENRLALFLLPIKGTKGGQVRSQPRGLFTER